MAYLLALFILSLDQIIKLLIRNNFNLAQSKPVIKNIFHLTYVQNTGASFGILPGYQNVFILLSILIIIVLLYYRWRKGSKPLLETASGLIVGGALGNVIDRVFLGFVVDYLDFRFWPVFNLADSAIVIGASLLAIYLWREEELN